MTRKSGRELDTVARVADDAVMPWWPATVGQEPDAQTYESMFAQVTEDTFILTAGLYDAAAHQQLLEDALTAIAALADTHPFGINATLILNGEFSLSETLVFDSSVSGLAVKGGNFIPLVSGSWTTSTPLIQIDTTRSHYEGLKFDCGSICAGIENIGGHNIITGCRGLHYTSYGMKENGSAGGTWYVRNYLQQWGSGDDEFADDINWTAKGLWLVNGDVKVVGNTFNWNGGGNIYAESPAGTTLVRGNHFFNGRPSGDPTVNLPNIYLGPGVGLYSFVHNYCDNGTIELYTDNVAFDSNFGLLSSNADLDYWCRLYGAVGRNHPDRFQWRNWQFSGSDLSGGTVPALVYQPYTFFSGVLTNPFTTTNGSPTVVVAHTAHGIPVGGGPVTATFSGASAVGGITINGTYAVTGVDANTYTITHGSNATSDATGGGSVTTTEQATYSGTFTHYSDSNDHIGLNVLNNMAIGASRSTADYSLSILAANGNAQGARIAFRDADTTTTDGVPTIGSRGNRMRIQFQDSDGLILQNTVAANAKLQFADINTTINPYIRSSTNNLVIDAPVITPEDADTQDLGSVSQRWNYLYAVNFILKPPASAPALTQNGQVVMELTDNTTLTFKARGSDGTTRSGTITLS